MNPTLLIMAAGMGSRYGGFKQIEPVGPTGEIIIEYSIHDALRAGFDKVVFVIKKEMEHDFRERVGKKIESKIDVAYAFQNVQDVPKGFAVPMERVKPWGTAHAVLTAKKHISSSFAVINADDFYGASSFASLADYLKENKNEKEFYQYCMVGFILKNTMTEQGHVARGICKVDESSYLYDIEEYTHIEKCAEGARHTGDGINYQSLDIASIVSMNTWGFTQSILNEIEESFPVFLEKQDLLKAEFFLPTVVDSLIKANKAKVKVLPNKERWYGITYKEDRQRLVSAISQLISQGKYPKDLWRDYIEGRK